MLSCETCYHGGPLEKSFIAVISVIVVQFLHYCCENYLVFMCPLYVVISCVILCGGAIKCMVTIVNFSGGFAYFLQLHVLITYSLCQQLVTAVVLCHSLSRALREQITWGRLISKSNDGMQHHRL